MLASTPVPHRFSGPLGGAALAVGLHAVVLALVLAAGGGRVVLTAPQQPVQVRLLPAQPTASQPLPPALALAPRLIAPPPVAIPLPELPPLALAPEPAVHHVETAAPHALAPSAAAPAAGADGSAGGESARAAAAPAVVERIAYAHFEPPAYPPLSRRLGEQGLVLLQVLIDEDGRPVRVDVHRSSGYARLDHAALEAVRRARFHPHREGDRPRAAIALVPVRFELT